jgi:biopolymer transport protein ExbD
MSEFLPEMDAEGEAGSPDPGLTPLVDVVFQLLVFFILTSTFASPALDIVLPQLSDEKEVENPEAWRVELDAAGNLAVEGEVIPADQIEGTIQTLLARAPDRDTAIVAADDAVSHGRVLEVMQTLGQAGIRQLLFEHEVVIQP